MTASNTPNDRDLPILEHLVELRNRVVWSALATLISVAICFAYVGPIWDFLVAPLNQALEATGKGSLATHDVFEGIITQLKVSLLAGILLASPIISYQVWKFIFPALTEKEASLVLPVSFASTLLFAGGVTFGYSVIFEYLFPFALEVTADNVEAVLSISSYLGTSTKLLLAFGLSFQLPVVVFMLSKLGLVHHRDMMTFFRYAVVIILIISALLTPPDPLSQMLMAIPLIALYGVSIIIAFIFSTKEMDPPSEENII
jgi:sec-independent protein translocase protein TatC